MIPDDPPSRPAPPRTRGRRERGRPPFPSGLVAAAATGAALLGLVLWFHLLGGPLRLLTGLLDASRHLESTSRRLSAGNADAARFEVLAGSAGVDRARAASDGAPLLDVLSAAPVVGPALEEIDHVIAAADHSATAARGSVAIASNALEGPDSIIDRGGKGGGDSRVRIERVAEIGREIGGLRSEVEAAQEELGAIDLGNLPDRADRAVAEALQKAEEAEAALVDADAAFDILPAVLGADGPRTYLIGFQNTAEARGTGGALLQFVLMNVDEGRLSLERDKEKTGTIYAIDEDRQQIDIPLPDDAWYQAGIPDARRFGNANWSPDFPLSTKLLLDYAYASDAAFPQVDGVIAVDPKVIEELIPAVGPIKVPGREAIGADGIVSYILNGQYAAFPKPRERRAHLRVLVDRFYSKIFDPKSPTKLLDGLSDSLAGKRMQIWMRKGAEQSFIKRMDWDGAIERNEKNDFLYIVEQNVGGNKFDFFDIHENRVEIEIDGDAATTSTSIAVSHDAFFPQPSWVMGDSGRKTIEPVHRPMMVLYSHRSAELLGSSVEGTRVDSPAPAIWPGGTLPPTHLERGKQAWPVTMEALAGETVRATFRYRVPGIVRRANGRNVYRLTVQHQPKVRPEWMDIDLRLPDGARDIRVTGWKREGRNGIAWAGGITRDMTLEVSWRE